MLSTVLSKIGVPVLVDILSDVLGGVDHPAAHSASKALGTLDRALSQGEIDVAQIEEANRHAEKMAEIRTKENALSLSEVNQSLRSEITSDDIYVRRMRPTFGYLMALTWTAQMFGVAYIMVFRTSEAHIVLEAVESLGLIWTVGLSVLGIYVYKRSGDKRS